MNVSDEAVGIVVSNSLRVTESVAKLTGLGAKHLALLVFTLMQEQMNDKNKMYGKTSLVRLLNDGDTRDFQIAKTHLAAFCKEAKNFGVLWHIAPTEYDNPNADVIIRAADYPKLNRIFEKIGYVAEKMNDNEKNEVPRLEFENELKKQKSGYEKTSGVVVSRIENAKERLAGQSKKKLEKGKQR